MEGYKLSDHAAAMLERRDIARDWLDHALQFPEIVTADKRDPALQHYLVTIPENENRVLRVVVNTSREPFTVVTVFFDRKMRGKL